MELPPDVRLIRLTQRIGQDAAFNTVAVYRLEFTVGGQGPFSLDTPTQGYSGELGKKLMTARAAEISASFQP